MVQVEAVMLASAILVCLAGLMFSSDRFAPIVSMQHPLEENYIYYQAEYTSLVRRRVLFRFILLSGPRTRYLLRSHMSPS